MRGCLYLASLTVLCLGSQAQLFQQQQRQPNIISFPSNERFQPQNPVRNVLDTNQRLSQQQQQQSAPAPQAHREQLLNQLRPYPQIYNPPRLVLTYSSQLQSDGSRRNVYPPTLPPFTHKPPTPDPLLRTTPRTPVPQRQLLFATSNPQFPRPGVQDILPAAPSEELLRQMQVHEQYGAYLTASWTAWSPWSDCVEGVRMRVRGCYRTSRYGKCVGSNHERQNCDTGAFMGTDTKPKHNPDDDIYFPEDPYADDRREAMKQLGIAARK